MWAILDDTLTDRYASLENCLYEVTQAERLMRMIDDPLANPRMVLRKSQELVETTDQGRYAQERRGLLD